MLIYGAVGFTEEARAKTASAVRAMRWYHEQRGLASLPAIGRPGILLHMAVHPRRATDLRMSRFITQDAGSSFGFFGSHFASASNGSELGMAASELSTLMRRLEMGESADIYRLDAEFCAVLIEEKERRVTFLKDHFGTRPLNYWVDRVSGMVAFASTVGGLCAIEGVDLSPNKRAMGSYLVAWFPPADETFFDSIRSVPSASSVTIAERSVRLARHWRPQPNEAWWQQNKREPVAAFREELVRSIVSRMSPTGKTALGLSSGIDSGTIACVAARRKPGHELVSFTEVLPESYVGPAWDERAGVERLAGCLPSLQAVFVDGRDCDPLAMGAPSYSLWRRPNPSVQSYFYDYLSAQAGAAGAPVVLCGLGGDQCVSADVEGVVPELLLSGRLGAAWTQVRRLGTTYGISQLQAAKAFLLAPLCPPLALRFYQAVRGQNPWDEFAVRREFAVDVHLEAYLERTGWCFPHRRPRTLNGRAIDDLEELIHSGRLSGESQFAAWHGVEYRYPLLDWRLIEAALAIPSSFKASAEQSRLLFRDAARPYVPAFIIDNARKGPGSPYLQTRVRSELHRLRTGFERFSAIPLWREIVDKTKVAAGMHRLETSSNWEIGCKTVNEVLQPFFLGDYLERTSFA